MPRIKSKIENLKEKFFKEEAKVLSRALSTGLQTETKRKLNEDDYSKFVEEKRIWSHALKHIENLRKQFQKMQ